MARAYGANTQLVGKFESSYGTPPSGNYNQLPFVSSDLGSEQGLIASDLLGQGRDPAAPIRDVIRVEGNVVVPVDLRNFGLWLKALLGAPTTEEDGDNYTHTFVSGIAALPSLSLEVGMPDIPAYFLSSGIRANSLQLNFSRSGAANATINCIAQGETRASSSGGGAPTVLSLTRFNQFQGSVKKDGSVLGNVTGAQLTYSNNLERIETIRSDGKIEGADPTIAALTGNIDVRFADTALIDAATNNTPIELEFAYTISENFFLIFTAHQVFLPKPKLAVSGPGGIQATFDWQAAKASSPARMLTVTLNNDVETYA
jgi:hypothetical protein